MSRSIQSRLPAKPRTMQQQARERNRASSTLRGYDKAWIALRARHLREHPGCVVCGAIHHSNNVDHVVPHKGDDRLRLDPLNLQTLCARHHSRKTAAQDGGFGNRMA